MDYVIVFLLGMAVTMVPAALWAASKRRPAAATPASPAQPPAPVIVLQSAPNNYTYTEIYNDNRQIVMSQPPTAAPLVTEQLSLAQYPSQKPPARRFKVVGERQEWRE